MDRESEGDRERQGNRGKHWKREETQVDRRKQRATYGDKGRRRRQGDQGRWGTGRHNMGNRGLQGRQWKTEKDIERQRKKQKDRERETDRRREKEKH